MPRATLLKMIAVAGAMAGATSRPRRSVGTGLIVRVKRGACYLLVLEWEFDTRVYGSADEQEIELRLRVRSSTKNMVFFRQKLGGGRVRLRVRANVIAPADATLTLGDSTGGDYIRSPYDDKAPDLPGRLISFSDCGPPIV